MLTASNRNGYRKKMEYEMFGFTAKLPSRLNRTIAVNDSFFEPTCNANLNTANSKGDVAHGKGIIFVFPEKS